MSDDKKCDYMMKVKELSFSYGKNRILNNISLKIPKGRITTILGANGCGKSTLFSLMTKNLVPDRGRIFLQRKNIGGMSLGEFAKRVSIVHQYNTAADDMTVERLVSMGRTPYHKMFSGADGDDEKLINMALEVTNLLEFKEREIGKLSGGQRQRVWIAMALAQNTKLLFLDEPTTYLDIRYQLEILELVKKLNREFGITIVMVLHEINQAIRFSDSIIGLKDGNVLAETRRFKNGTAIAELDLQRLVNERRRMNTYTVNTGDDYEIVDFALEKYDLGLTRYYARTPFVPSSKVDRDVRCEEILSIQAMGLKKRLAHTGCRSAVIGISGGLDSTLALLVTARAFDSLSIPRENITAVTMPCFGTTDRTYNNAVELTRRLGATLTEVNIKEAVRIHFRDIGQDESVHDVTYENGQARERTQILMDIANKSGGMVIGTGDMSELALGWATYNGDHMSMYGVNCSVPKTLVRHLVKYYADTCGDSSLREILEDVLDTPVSPELLPPTEGQISQKTEDLVGPYELHDFFMYYILRFGYMPHKVYRIACHAFEGEYDTQTIYRWLDTFYRRFFAQQFKRSCLPDGPKVGSVAVSPRGDLRMPSDAVRSLWLEDLASINDLNKSRQ